VTCNHILRLIVYLTAESPRRLGRFAFHPTRATVPPAPCVLMSNRIVGATALTKDTLMVFHANAIHESRVEARSAAAPQLQDR
jgi:hypothetical protein